MENISEFYYLEITNNDNDAYIYRGQPRSLESAIHKSPYWQANVFVLQDRTEFGQCCHCLVHTCLYLFCGGTAPFENPVNDLLL